MLEYRRTNCRQRLQFKVIAWAFGPCIQAVPYIRPVISVDACFLSGRYDGRLLIACADDAENQLLPLAFAIVEKEDGENWGFFMRFVRRQVVGNRYFCVISDQHKGIKYVFDRPDFGWSTANGDCVHRLCMQHVTDNLHKNCGSGKWVADTFRIGCKKKKPRRVEEMFKDFAKVCIFLFVDLYFLNYLLKFSHLNFFFFFCSTVQRQICTYSRWEKIIPPIWLSHPHMRRYCKPVMEVFDGEL